MTDNLIDGAVRNSNLGLNLQLIWIYAGTEFCGKAGIEPPQPIVPTLFDFQLRSKHFFETKATE